MSENLRMFSGQEKHLDLYVKYLLSVSDFNQNWFMSENVNHFP